MGFQQLKLGWDLDLVLIADGKKWGLRDLWMEGADEDSDARKKNCKALLGGRDSCAEGVGARNAMAGRRCGSTGAVDRGDEENRGKKRRELPNADVGGFFRLG